MNSNTELKNKKTGECLISIIIPVYNVEEYFDRCITSVVSQRYRNLEIILVDDGSTDSCSQMCDEWEKKDSRIKVIHKHNGGLSDARNVGMNIATGDYVCFIDSDDWVEYDYISELYTAIIDNQCDIASCRARMIWDNGTEKDLSPEIETTVFLNNIDAMRDLISGFHLIQTVWNKLYRSSVIKSIAFPVGRINEDEFWTWKVIANSRRVVCVNAILYNYYQRDGSIMKNKNSFDPLAALEASCERHEYILDNMDELKNISCIHLLYSCLFQAQRASLLLDKKRRDNAVRQIKEIVDTHKPDFSYVRTLGLKKYVRIFTIYHNFELIYHLQNAFGIGNESNV